MSGGHALLDDGVTRRNLPHMISMCLSWIRHALAAVDLLDLVDQVLLRLADTEDAQHVLWSGVPWVSCWPTST